MSKYQIARTGGSGRRGMWRPHRSRETNKRGQYRDRRAREIGTEKMLAGDKRRRRAEQRERRMDKKKAESRSLTGELIVVM